MRRKPKPSGLSQRTTPVPDPGPEAVVEPTSVPAIVTAAFARLNVRRRARMLGRLLASVGPLALAVVGGGAFAKYVAQARLPEIPVSLDDAARATSGQIYDLVRYVQQSNPQLFAHLLDALARDPTTIAALGASIAALGINRLAARGPSSRIGAAGTPAPAPGAEPTSEP